MQCGFGVCSTMSVHGVCGDTADERSLAPPYVSKTLFGPTRLRIVKVCLEAGAKAPPYKILVPRGVSCGSSVKHTGAI